MRRRITLKSALRTVETAYDCPPEAIRLDPEELDHRYLTVSAATLGLSRSTLPTYKSCIRSVLRRLGVIARRRRTGHPFMPAWQLLHERLPVQSVSRKLQAFMAWCSDHGIPPSAVGNDTLAEYASYCRANRLKGDPADVIRRCAKAWNRMAEHVDGWPSATLTAPKNHFRYTAAFGTYPVSLQADIEVFRQRLSGAGERGLYAEPSGSPTLKPESIKSRMQAIRMALAALVCTGTKPEDIGSLADLTTPEAMRKILNWHWERAGRKVTVNTGKVAETLRIIACHHVGLTGPALEEARTIAKAAKPKERRRMSPKNERRLAQFDDPDILAMVLNLAHERLMPLAAAQKQANNRTASWTACLAVATEILLRCPMRIENLAHLRLGHEIICFGRGKQRYTHIMIEGKYTKNGEPLRWPINPELSALIATFVDEYRCGIGGASSDYLFPGRYQNDRPRSVGGLSIAIKKAFHEHVGIELNPHLYRAIAGKFILDEHPGAIEEVRQVLGHRNLATSMGYYIAWQPKRAAARHDARVSALQKQTSTQAAVAFSRFRAVGPGAAGRKSGRKKAQL